MNSHPIPLPPNFVWRSYTGGSRLRDFRQAASRPADDHFPEDWLASSVTARNPGRDDPSEGISRVEVDGKTMLWTDFLREQAEAMLGTGRDSFGALIKLLDSAVRLHIQAHPDRDFARRKFGSDYGKTECWYVLETRSPEAYVHLGFQHPPAPADWLQMVQNQDRAAMRACFDRIPVKPGDCFMVPAGIPHAIGEGIFMIELQEPSDWVVRCEWEAGGYQLPESARWMGLQPEECLEMFDYRRYAPADIDAVFRQTPRLIEKGPSWIREEIIAPKWHGFFRLRRISGSGPAAWSGGEPTVAILVRGEGSLSGRPARTGDVSFLPFSASKWDWKPSGAGEWEILLALPPTR